MGWWPFADSSKPVAPDHSSSARKELFTTFDRELLGYEKRLTHYDSQLDADIKAILATIPPTSLIYPKATSAMRGRIATAKTELEAIFAKFLKNWKYMSSVREKKLVDDAHFINQLTDNEYGNLRIQANNTIDAVGRMFAALRELDKKLADNVNPHQAVNIFWPAFNDARKETIKLTKLLYGTLERGV